LPEEIFLPFAADHGHVEVAPDTTIYLSRDPAFAGFETFLKRNQAGNALVPAGSSRDIFLYIKDDRINEAPAFLQSRLEGIADVVKTQDLMDEVFFGKSISKTFLSRLGNLVILAYRYQSVWWYGKDKFEQNYIRASRRLDPAREGNPPNYI